MSRSALTATVLLATVAMAGCSSAASSDAKTFTATGTVVISLDSDQIFEPVEELGQMPVPKTKCEGQGQHADLTAGAQVLVRDARGKLLGVGELGAGVVNVEESSCSFALTVAKVPKEKSFYTLEVAHRGQNHYTEEKIQGPLKVNVP